MRLRGAGSALAGVESGCSSLIPDCDRAGLISRLHRVTSRTPAGRVPLRSSRVVDRSRSSCRASSDSDWAAKRRRLLSTSEAVTDAVITARKPIPDSITTAAMNRPTAASGVTSPYPTVVTVCSANQRPLPIVGYS